MSLISWKPNLQALPDVLLQIGQRIAEDRRNEAERQAILFRKFSPVSGYEPDPKREEWQGVEDCKGCPHFEWIHIGLDHGRKMYFPECKLRPVSPQWLPLGDPSLCRFGEYRRILFRKFGRRLEEILTTDEKEGYTDEQILALLRTGDEW